MGLKRESCIQDCLGLITDFPRLRVLSVMGELHLSLEKLSELHIRSKSSSVEFCFVGGVLLITAILSQSLLSAYFMYISKENALCYLNHIYLP